MSRPTDHEETIEHLRDIAGAIRDGSRSPITTPLPALEYIPPRILNADDCKLLRGLAVLLVARTTEAAKTMRTESLTAEGLTALAAATTAATTALIACREDNGPPEPDNGPPPAFVEGTTALSLLLYGDPAKVDRSETGAVVQRALEELAKAAKDGAS